MALMTTMRCGMGAVWGLGGKGVVPDLDTGHIS